MKLRLISKKPEAADAVSFFFEPDRPVTWQPGQYFHYTFPHPKHDERGIERWFTISSAPFEKQVRLTTRLNEAKLSSFKKSLAELPAGREIEAEGPGGKFILDSSKPAVLIAGGIGVTPYRSMLLQMDHDSQDIRTDLLYANRDNNFVFMDELEAVASRHPGLHIKKFTGDRKIGKSDLEKYVSGDAIVYVSGPEPMVEDFKQLLLDMGFGEERVKTDYFPGYEADLS